MCNIDDLVNVIVVRFWSYFGQAYVLLLMCTYLSSAIDSAGVWLGSSAELEADNTRPQNAVCARNPLMFANWRYRSSVTSLQGLTSSCAKITSLQLDYISSAKLQHVCTMKHLSSLIIFKSNSFTGFELATQPNLPRL